MGSPHPAGTVLVVTLEGDADRRPMRAVYLGVVECGVDRPDRRMYAVDDGDPTMGWALLMEPQIDTVDLVPPPITMAVGKDAAYADIEELASLIRDAIRAKPEDQLMILKTLVAFGLVDAPPPITMIVVKDTAVSYADIEELVSLIRDANQDTGGFLIVPKDVMDQVDPVQVQDKPDAPDAVAALRKVLKGQDGDLTPAEVALCARLRSS